MSTLRFFATLPHYAAHLRPYIDALNERGIVAEVWEPPATLPDDGAHVVIAGMGDIKLVPADYPVALVSHGVDQTYVDLDHASYAGGRGRERVGLFLCPSERAAALNTARYPDAEVCVVGPAHLDGLRSRRGSASATTGAATIGDAVPKVVFTWHWDARIHPEIRTAWPHYIDVFRRFVDQNRDRYEILGHAHPRAWEMVEPTYRDLGIGLIHDPTEALIRADLVVADNTSFLYEAAAVGIPTLTLDAPWYRDQPRHGLRFYEHVPGLRLRSYRDQAPDVGVTHQFHGRDHLAEAIEIALADPVHLKNARRKALAVAYGPLDDHAGDRGAEALARWAGV